MTLTTKHFIVDIPVSASHSPGPCCCACRVTSRDGKDQRMEEFETGSTNRNGVNSSE